MSDFLDHLIDRHVGTEPQIRPRLPTLFEQDRAQPVTQADEHNDFPVEWREESATRTSMCHEPEPLAPTVRSTAMQTPSSEPNDIPPEPKREKSRTMHTTEEAGNASNQIPESTTRLQVPSIQVRLSPMDTPVLPVSNTQAPIVSKDAAIPNVRVPNVPADRTERTQAPSDQERSAARLDVRPVLKPSPLATNVLNGEKDRRRNEDEDRHDQRVGRRDLIDHHQSQNTFGILNTPKVPTVTAPVITPPSPPEPVINVTIGRIEVKATTTPPKQTEKAERRTPVMGLDEYLRRRSGEHDR